MREVFLGAVLMILYTVSLATIFQRPAPAIERVIEYRYACDTPYETRIPVEYEFYWLVGGQQ